MSYIFSGGGSIIGGTSLVMSGPGSLTLSSSNTYTGGDDLSGGVLNDGAANSLGTGPLKVNGGTLNANNLQSLASATLNAGLLNLADSSALSGVTLTISGRLARQYHRLGHDAFGNNPQNWNSSFTFVGSQPLNMGTGAVTMNASPAVVVGASTLTVSGAITGTGALTKNGPGTLVLAGNNGFASGATLANGLLVLNNNNAVGPGTLTINGGTLDSTVASGITLPNNTQIWNGDFTFVGTQNVNLGTGVVSLGSSRTVTVSGGTLTVGGVISGGGDSLRKAGARQSDASCGQCLYRRHDRQRRHVGIELSRQRRKRRTGLAEGHSQRRRLPCAQPAGRPRLHDRPRGPGY